MYYQHLADSELGFDPFIAPDDFDHANSTQYSGDHPVDIYEIFKREYVLNSHARYIYYYSPGNYPLTLTPTSTEYYRYGYTTGGTEVIVDVPLNGSAKTIWGASGNTSGFDESGYTKRWVVVCRPSTAKFSLTLAVARAGWLYCGDKINEVKGGMAGMQLKYIHFANLNSITGNFQISFNTEIPLYGRCVIPETVLYLLGLSFRGSQITKVNLPTTKDVAVDISNTWANFKPAIVTEYNFGACTNIQSEFNLDSDRNVWTALSVLSVSSKNTRYASFDNCDIIYNKALTAIVWIAPKTVRGLYIPNELPQSEIGTTGTGITTKLSTNVMQGYPLHIGTQITDLTNLYLSNKSFTTITVGAGNTAFSVENNILFNADKTTLVKAGSASPGSLIIPTTVTTASSDAFLRYTHTGSIPLEFSGTGQFDLSNYNNFQFATFTGQSLSDIITNEKLLPGTAGSPKFFCINQASLDALNAYNSNAVNIAAGRYINISAFPQGVVLHLDASNAASYPGSGTTWYDLSVNNNNGTLVNGVAYGSGVMNFDGINDYDQHTSPANLANQDFSVSFWLNPSQPNQAMVTFIDYDHATSGNQQGWVIQTEDFTTNNYIYLAYYDGSNYRPSAIGVGQGIQITKNIWNLVTFTKEGTSIKGYLNGVLVYNVTSLNANVKYIAGRNLRIGNAIYTGATRWFKGGLNDTFIYDKSLTQSEVSVIYNSQKSKYGL